MPSPCTYHLTGFSLTLDVGISSQLLQQCAATDPYFGRGVPLHGCSTKVQPLLLTLDDGYLLIAAPPDLERGVASLGPPAPCAAALLGREVTP